MVLPSTHFIVDPLCGPERATGSKVAVGAAVGASTGGKSVAVTTITKGVGVEPLQAERMNVKSRMHTNIT